MREAGCIKLQQSNLAQRKHPIGHGLSSFAAATQQQRLQTSNT